MFYDSMSRPCIIVQCFPRGRIIVESIIIGYYTGILCALYWWREVLLYIKCWFNVGRGEGILGNGLMQLSWITIFSLALGPYSALGQLGLFATRFSSSNTMVTCHRSIAPSIYANPTRHSLPFSISNRYFLLYCYWFALALTFALRLPLCSIVTRLGKSTTRDSLRREDVFIIILDLLACSGKQHV